MKRAETQTVTIPPRNIRIVCVSHTPHLKSGSLKSSINGDDTLGRARRLVEWARRVLPIHEAAQREDVKLDLFEDLGMAVTFLQQHPCCDLRLRGSDNIDHQLTEETR